MCGKILLKMNGKKILLEMNQMTSDYPIYPNVWEDPIGDESDTFRPTHLLCRMYIER